MKKQNSTAKGWMAFYRKRLPTMQEKMWEVSDSHVMEWVNKSLNDHFKMMSYFRGIPVYPHYKNWGIPNA